ncbi:MAG: methyltransferase domain-containing protein, partial [Alphaproteobacteria bacterium]|nr:methyltransferase domain-containing protein [Alphaproteobacteria bacterium]MBV9584747.1 methyltransferase domain-containing protein [Alphaproteobacteria bacterium]
MSDDLSATARLVGLLDHLGIAKAHVATQIAGDVSGLATAHAGRLGSIVLCAPVRLDPAPFAAVTGRVLMISGEYGPTFDVCLRAAERLQGAQRYVLDSYEALGWSDVAADRNAEIATTMQGFLQRFAADTPRLAVSEGSHAGISYRVEGSGPALLLLPFFLAPSQWVPVIPQLAQHFTVITLGGRHLGGIAALEDRASMPTYRAMFRTLIDLIAPKPGETILDVGCGAGSLDRLLAQLLGSANPITAIDVNPFWLREAEALAVEDGVAEVIRFLPGNAEAVPFPNNSFDAAFSVTVLEECDADRAIAEMMRVVRPDGRIGIIVRAIDLPQWWNLELPEEIRRKVTPPPQSVAANGVADASLYRRMRRAGLEDLTCFPSLVTLDRPDGPIWRYREDHVLSLLGPEELPVWRAARDQATRDGLLMMAHPLHAAVGRKPNK